MMRLNFAPLSTSMQKSWGQRGTAGTLNIHAGLGRPQDSENAGDTRGQIPAPVCDERAEILNLSPMSPIRPHGWGHGKPSIYAAVPVVPNVPAKKHINEIDRETFEERAAIMEFDGGLSRAEAEWRAAELLGVAV